MLTFHIPPFKKKISLKEKNLRCCHGFPFSFVFLAVFKVAEILAKMFSLIVHIKIQIMSLSFC